MDGKQDPATADAEARALVASGQPDRAIEIWRSLIDELPKSSKIHQKARKFIALTFIKRRKFVEALLEILSAEAIYPLDRDLPFWRAQLMAELQQPEAAIAAYQAVLQLDPGNRDIKNRLAQLGSDPDALHPQHGLFRIPKKGLLPAAANKLIDDVRQPSRNETSDDYWRIRNVQTVYSHFSWDLFGAEVMRAYVSKKKLRAPPKFYESGLYRGQLPAGDLARLKAEFDKCEKVAFEADDTFPHYYFDPKTRQAKAREFTSDFLSVTHGLLEAIDHWIKPIAAEIEALVGHNWSIRQVTAHKMHVHETPDDPQLAAVGWHVDGAPLCMKKLFIYLNGASSDLGSTEFMLRTGETVLVDGPPGVWALFENSGIRHRAVVPRKAPRPVIELLVVPSIETMTFPEAPTTMNSGYPLYPWPIVAQDDDAYLPFGFRRDELATRLNARVVGTARMVQKGDLSLEIDGHYVD